MAKLLVSIDKHEISAVVKHILSTKRLWMWELCTPICKVIFGER